MWATGGKGHRSLRGAYAPELKTVTRSFSCLTRRFDCSAVVFGLCFQQFEFGLCMCVELDCSLVLALLRGVLMYFSGISSELTHGLRKRFRLNKSLRNLTHVQVLLTRNFDMPTH